MLLLILLIGIFLIVIDRYSQPKIIYKYIPRTLEEESNQPVYVTDIFKSMFSEPGTWNYGLVDYDNRDGEPANAYNISQM
jgi:hypothetical protein